MNQETPSSRALDREKQDLKNVRFVTRDDLSDRRLFASQLIRKRQRFRRLLRLYATTGVVALTALAFLFD